MTIGKHAHNEDASAEEPPLGVSVVVVGYNEGDTSFKTFTSCSAFVFISSIRLVPLVCAL